MKNGPNGLRAVLEGSLKSTGMSAVVVSGLDGLVIEAVAAEEMDADMIGASVASAFGDAEAMGGELNAGVPVSILAEFEDGLVAVASAGPEALLAVVGKRLANPGRVRLAARRAGETVAKHL